MCSSDLTLNIKFRVRSQSGLSGPSFGRIDFFASSFELTVVRQRVRDGFIGTHAVGLIKITRGSRSLN